jgi:restriction system protein
MASRKHKHPIEPKTLFGFLVALGVIWLITQPLQHLPRGTGGFLVLLVLTAGTVAVAYLVARLLQRAGARRTLLRKTREAVEQHLTSLVRRRAQLVKPDPYGKPQVEKWAKEISYFISQHIQPLLTPSERNALARNQDKVLSTLGSLVESAMRSQPAFQTFANDMTPAEFETFCAEQLRRAGWDARVTMQSRDQGVDVIAEKNGRRVVLQCKLYARAVGNKSVQEVAAARAHEKADFGIVVSNNRYTTAAEQLATTNGILLLHYRDLNKLDDLLSRHPIRI